MKNKKNFKLAILGTYWKTELFDGLTRPDIDYNIQYNEYILF